MTLYRAWTLCITFTMSLLASIFPTSASWKVDNSSLIAAEPGRWAAAWVRFTNSTAQHATADGEVGWAEVYIAVADSTLFGIEVVPVDRFVEDFMVYSDLCTGAFAITGSFFRNLAPAESFMDDVPRAADGWVVSAGQEMSPLVNWTVGGAIVDDGEKAQVVPVRALRELVDPWMLVQSKPILLRGTANDMHGDDYKYSMFRTAIGTTETGDIAAVLIRAPDAGGGVSLYEAADMLIKINTLLPTGNRLRDILAMDGGPGAHLFIQKTADRIGGVPPVFIPNFLCIKERDTDAPR